jgi:hypothetical protein
MTRRAAVTPEPTCAEILSLSIVGVAIVNLRRYLPLAGQV